MEPVFFLFDERDFKSPWTVSACDFLTIFDRERVGKWLNDNTVDFLYVYFICKINRQSLIYLAMYKIILQKTQFI